MLIVKIKATCTDIIISKIIISKALAKWYDLSDQAKGSLFYNSFYNSWLVKGKQVSSLDKTRNDQLKLLRRIKIDQPF